MARYDYQCPACGQVFEIEHSVSYTGKVKCPDCGKKMDKVFINLPAMKMKGDATRRMR